MGIQLYFYVFVWCCEQQLNLWLVIMFIYNILLLVLYSRQFIDLPCQWNYPPIMLSLSLDKITPNYQPAKATKCARSRQTQIIYQFALCYTLESYYTIHNHQHSASPPSSHCDLHHAGCGNLLLSGEIGSLYLLLLKFIEFWLIVVLSPGLLIPFISAYCIFILLWICWFCKVYLMQGIKYD